MRLTEEMREEAAKHWRLVTWLACLVRRWGRADEDDAVSWACEAVCLAVACRQRKPQYALSTLARRYVKRAAYNDRRAALTAKRKVRLLSLSDTRADLPAVSSRGFDMVDAMDECAALLTERETSLLVAVVVGGQSIQEAAGDAGISRPRASEVIAAARAKLRRSAR